jgi:hypothetical protein
MQDQNAVDGAGGNSTGSTASRIDHDADCDAIQVHVDGCRTRDQLAHQYHWSELT